MLLFSELTRALHPRIPSTNRPRRGGAYFSILLALTCIHGGKAQADQSSASPIHLGSEDQDFFNENLFGRTGEATPPMLKDGLGPYELKKVPSDGIEKYMPIGNGDLGLPESMYGIWWMDGNPSGDVLVTLANLSFNRSTLSVKLPVYGANQYTYLDSSAGAQAFAAALKIKLVYEVAFNEARNKALVTPVLTIKGHEIRIPKWLARFTMGLQEDGHWVRYSWLFGLRVANYDLRRVVNVVGTRTPAYEDYLKFAGKFSLLPVIKSESAR